MTHPETMIILDSGATFAITPHLEDFIPGTYVPINSTVKGLTSTTPIIGKGTIRWQFKDIHGIPATLKAFAHHIPLAEVRLFSPQHFLQCEGGGEYLISKDTTFLTLKDGMRLEVPYHPSNGLPTVLHSPRPSCHLAPSSHDVFLSVLDDANQNLSSPQKELLFFHSRFGHINFRSLQSNMREHLFEDKDGHSMILKPVIPTKYKQTKSCIPPKCSACLLGKAKKRSTSGMKTQSRPPNPLPTEAEPGSTICCDHYESSIKGRKENTYGKEKDTDKYVGGTIFCDAATGFIYIAHQVSLRVGDTIKSKNNFEQMATSLGVKVQSYFGDNGVFTAKGFKADLVVKNQAIRFSGAGAHHQNGIAERAIQTVTYLSRSMIIHMCLHWPDQSTEIDLWPFALTYAAWIWNRFPSLSSGFSPLELFSQTKSDHKDLNRARVWGSPTYVLDPKLQDGIKLPKWNPRAQRGQFLGFSSEHSTTVGLLRNIRTGNITPQYHVVIDELFNTVPNVDFGLAILDSSFLNKRWDELLRFHRDFYLPENLTSEEFNSLPPLDEEWISRDQARLRRLDLQRNFNRRLSTPVDDSDPPENFQGDKIQHPIDTDDDIQNEDLSSSRQREHSPMPVKERGTLEEEDLPIMDSPPSNASRSPLRLIDDDAKEPLTPPPDLDSDLSYDAVDLEPVQLKPSSKPAPDLQKERIQPTLRRSKRLNNKTLDPLSNAPGRIRRSRRKTKPNSKYQNYTSLSSYLGQCPIPEPYKHDRRCNLGVLNSSFLNAISWNNFDYDTSGLPTTWNSLVASLNQNKDKSDDTFLDISPLILTVRANATDTPNWYQAMNGPDAEGYWEAMEQEISTLVSMDAWEEVPVNKNYNILDSTWAFKCKRYPDGRVKKLKARFCVRGDQQVEGVDFFETFAPVVQWSTIRLLLVLSRRLGFSTAQVDYTAAFVQAAINEDVFVQMPKGFRKRGTILKLRRSLYGLKQSPRNFFNHLKDNLQSKTLNFIQSQHDPCLFFGKNCIIITYVDDCLFFSKDIQEIDRVIDQLRYQGMSLNKEEDVAGFLGINISRLPSGDIEMTQRGLIDRIITTLGLEDANPKHTPALIMPLAKDENGEEAEGSFNYASVVGMLLYLQGNTRPDISFAVNQCARFSANPKKSHEVALKHIGRYLKATNTKGLIMKNDPMTSLDCWCDADFAGLWKVEQPDDPISVKSRTGFIFTLGSCPILWTSKLQTEIALSTMEAEYVALSAAMREFIPLQRTLFEIAKKLQIQCIEASKINSTIWEDNNGCLTLANLEPPRMTPRSKHYGTKYHWFREKLKELNITLEKVDTQNQLADMMTKGLPSATLKFLRKKLMGW